MFGRLNLKSEFLRYILVLTTGTVLAQVISYLFAPVITHLYLPEETAELGLFLRIVGVGAAMATLRYELALPIPKIDIHSFRLYQIALRSTLIISLLALIILLVPAGFSADIDELIFYLLLPVALLFTAIYNIGTNWSVRLKFFRSISLSKVTNSLFGGTLKIVFGIFQFGYIGLIIGATLGIIASNFWFVRDYLTARNKFKVSSRSKRNYVLAKQYKDFPRINLPHVLMDLGRDLLVAVLLLELFSKEDFGLFDHSYRMLRLPLVLVGLGIGQVFFQRCAEKVNNGEPIRDLLLRSVKTLALLSIIPFGVVFLYGEEMFAFVFGENWRGAGEFSEIMVPWFLINFISSPISSVPLILNKQKEFFLLSAGSAVLMVGSIVLPYYLYQASIEMTLWIMSVSQAIYLLFIIFKIFDFARNKN